MSSKLTAYRAKRNPARTPEPMGALGENVAPKNSAAAPSFVIQEHHASALHWDFRLERDGVLVSWALPKGIPVDPKHNRLAVHTEDHPLEYGSFEGDIPPDEYGGGHVTIWDRGTYDLVTWRDDEVMIDLHGTRATGRYVLFPTGGTKWMIHRMDPPPLGFEPMPTTIAPMLATPGELPTSESGWAYEFKWDGVRAVISVDGGRVRAVSRNGKDLTANFPELRSIGEFFGSRSVILDGEIVTLDDAGMPRFETLAHRLHVGSTSVTRRRMRESPASFFAFDLLYLDGRSTVALPYDDRRTLLESLGLHGNSFATPPSVRGGTGVDVVAVAKERGLEGVVVKRRNSLYAPGRRNGDWVKVKNVRTQEVVIGGWTDGRGGLVHNLGALLVGVPGATGLLYAGKVGTGFTDDIRRALLEQLTPLATTASPFTTSLSPTETRRAHFVRPEIVGEVRFGEWTSSGHLRHAAWRGVRPDKEVTEVVRES